MIYRIKDGNLRCMTIQHIVSLTVYHDICDLFASSKLKIFNKEVIDRLKLNISNKASQDSNSFMFVSIILNLSHIPQLISMYIKIVD